MMEIPNDKLPCPHKDLPAAVCAAYLDRRDGFTRRGPSEKTVKGPVLLVSNTREVLSDIEVAGLSRLAGTQAAADEWKKMESLMGDEALPKIFGALLHARQEWERVRLNVSRANVLVGEIATTAIKLGKLLDEFSLISSGVAARYPDKNPNSPRLSEELEGLIERCTSFDHPSDDRVLIAGVAKREQGREYERALMQALNEWRVVSPYPRGFLASLARLADMMSPGVDYKQLLKAAEERQD